MPINALPILFIYLLYPTANSAFFEMISRVELMDIFPDKVWRKACDLGENLIIERKREELIVEKGKLDDTKKL